MSEINYSHIVSAWNRGGARRALAELDRQGFVIVPKEPTQEQYARIMGGGIDEEKAKAFYRAMVSADP